MKLKIGLLFSMLTIFIGANAQTGNGEQRDFYNANSSIQLRGVQVDTISTDVGMNANSDDCLPTQKAVKAYVDSHGGGGTPTLAATQLAFGDGGNLMTSDANLVYSAGSVGIGTPTPDASAILDLTSTTKALLPPRMNTSQMNGITATAGDVVYNTDSSSLCYFNGSVWLNVISSGGGGTNFWTATGNTIANNNTSTVNIIGQNIATPTMVITMPVGAGNDALDINNSDNRNVLQVTRFDAIDLLEPISGSEVWAAEVNTLSNSETFLASPAGGSQIFDTQGDTTNDEIQQTLDNSNNAILSTNSDRVNNSVIQFEDNAGDTVFKAMGADLSFTTYGADKYSLGFTYSSMDTSTKTTIGWVNNKIALLSNSFSQSETAALTVTVSIPTQVNNSYHPTVTPTSLLASTAWYISAKTTTSFTITYATALTGTLTFDYSIFP